MKKKTQNRCVERYCELAHFAQRHQVSPPCVDDNQRSSDVFETVGEFRRSLRADRVETFVSCLNR